MKPYGERIPRVHWRENHGCQCCDSYKVLRAKDRKPSKARERNVGKSVIAEELGQILTARSQESLAIIEEFDQVADDRI